MLQDRNYETSLKLSAALNVHFTPYSQNHVVLLVASTA